MSKSGINLDSWAPLTGRDLADFGYARLRDQLFDTVLQLWRQRKSEGVTIPMVAARIGRKPKWVKAKLSAPGDWTLKVAGALIQGLDGEFVVAAIPVHQLFDGPDKLPLFDPATVINIASTLTLDPVQSDDPNV